MENEDELSVALDDNRTLYLSEVSRAAFDDQAVDELGGDGGLFVLLEDCREQSLTILAKAASIQTGRQLMELIAVARRQMRSHLTVVK